MKIRKDKKTEAKVLLVAQIILISLMILSGLVSIFAAVMQIQTIDVKEAQKVIDQKASELVIPEDVEIEPKIVEKGMSYRAKQLVACTDLDYCIDMDYSKVEIKGFKLLDNITLVCEGLAKPEQTLLSEEDIDNGFGVLAIDVAITNKRDEIFTFKNDMFSIKLNDIVYNAMEKYNFVLLNMEPLCSAAIGKDMTQHGSLYFKVPLFELRPENTPRWLDGIESDEETKMQWFNRDKQLETQPESGLLYLHDLEFSFLNDDELYIENITQFEEATE